jgi:hypothetical protein
MTMRFPGTGLCQTSLANGGRVAGSSAQDTAGIQRPRRTTPAAFKNLKGDLSLRPVYHQREDRIEAHIFVSLLA